MPLQTRVTGFVIDHGRVTEEGGRLRNFQRRRLDEPDVDLHLLAEPGGPNAEEVGAQALQATGRLFVGEGLRPDEQAAIRTHPSITGGLLAALRFTHQTLVDWNRRSIESQQVAVGIAAVARRGTTAYLAQAGPSLAYIFRQDVLTRLVPTGDAAAPLGEGSALEPALRRLDLEAGDLLIATSPRLEALLDEDTLAELLSRGSDFALPELYLLSRDLPNFALLCVTCFEAEEEPAPADLPAGQAGAATSTETAPAAGALAAAPAEGAGEETEEGGSVLTSPQPLDISRPVVRLRYDQPGGRAEYTRTTGPGGLRLQLPRPLFLSAVALIAVVLLAAFTLPGVLNENQQEKTAALLTKAGAVYNAALNEPDPEAKRDLLQETRRLTADALRRDPDNTVASDLRQQATASLSALDAVLNLDPMTTVTVLGRQVTGDISIDRIAVGGGSVYLLDSRGRRVIAVPLGAAGRPVVAFEDGASYGGVRGGRPLYLTWDTSEGRLLVLDAERHLYEVRPGAAPQPLPLRQTTIWQSVADIAAYDGNLYVLDPQANQVRRYRPAAAGFDSEPENALGNQAPFTKAIDLAVSNDVFLLMTDGSIRRFKGGIESPFRLGGIDRPLETAVSLNVLVGAQEVFVVDRGNKRVVVAGADGRFLRQFVSNAFTDLRAAAVDDAGSQLYAVVGDALLTAPLIR